MKDKSIIKIEIKYSILGLIAIPPFFAGFIPTNWLCNNVPDGIWGLIIVISYVLFFGVATIKYELFILRKYYNEISKYHK